MAQVQKLELTGKRWFDRKNGNTYFSALAVLDDVEVAAIACEYGYDEQWLYEICDKLDQSGVIPVKREVFKNGSKEVPWQWLQRIEKETGVVIFRNCIDVKRKKDL